MEIINQLLVRIPKWIVSWILVFLDATAGYIVLKNIFFQFELDFSVSSIFFALLIFWCFLFWITNLYSGDAQTSRFVETENLIKLIMVTRQFKNGMKIITKKPLSKFKF